MEFPPKGEVWREILKLMETEGRQRKAPVYAFPPLPWKWKLVALLLSARTRDEVTLSVLRTLRRKGLTWIAEASPSEIAEVIRPVGFYRRKATLLRALVQRILRMSKPPEDPRVLPGIGRKAAGVFLASLGKPVVGVDTHVARILRRFGFTTPESGVQTIPVDLRPLANRVLVGFGQTVCLPRRPRCEGCPFLNCPSRRVPPRKPRIPEGEDGGNARRR